MMTGRLLIPFAAALLLAAAPSSKDLDNDGVRNRKDTCPDTAVGAKVDKVGCPVDTDGDGVADGIDRCSRTPHGWPVDATGCPIDSDQDQVVDAQDSCPGTPRGATVDSRGCPSDADGDAVLDGLDRCASTPAGARVDAYGCPLDGDHDGVLDGFDQCPDSQPREQVDSGGCRVLAPPLFEFNSNTLVLEGVAFEPNRIELAGDSAEPLVKAVASLKDHPEERVEIGVYTDSRGDRSKNLELSRRRAEYVRQYLVTLGIDASRLTAKGYGEVKPIADNKTDEGRARNRRIELMRLEAPQVAGIK